jgi:hypothetical protein
VVMVIAVEIGFSSSYQSLRHFGVVERDVVQRAVFQRALMAKEMVCKVVDKGDV